MRIQSKVIELEISIAYFVIEYMFHDFCFSTRQPNRLEYISKKETVRKLYWYLLIVLFTWCSLNIRYYNVMNVCLTLTNFVNMKVLHSQRTAENRTETSSNNSSGKMLTWYLTRLFFKTTKLWQLYSYSFLKQKFYKSENKN